MKKIAFYFLSIISSIILCSASTNSTPESVIKAFSDKLISVSSQAQNETIEYFDIRKEAITPEEKSVKLAEKLKNNKENISKGVDALIPFYVSQGKALSDVELKSQKAKLTNDLNRNYFGLVSYEITKNEPLENGNVKITVAYSTDNKVANTKMKHNQIFILVNVDGVWKIELKPTL